MPRILCPMLCVGLTVVSWSRDSPADAIKHEASAGAVVFGYLPSFGDPATYYGTTVGYGLAFGIEGAWRVGVGLRSGYPFDRAIVPLEAYVWGAIAASVGHWTPAVGPEIGVTGYDRTAATPPRIEDGIAVRQKERIGRGYLAFNAAAARFKFGGFTISVLSFQIGSTFTPLGTAARFQLGLVEGSAAL